MENVILWTQEDCSLCGKIKAYFSETGYEERPAEELISGEKSNNEAMVQLAMQNMQLPIVQVDGCFVDVDQILAKADGKAA